jgi:hypothetical protein
MQIQLLSAGDIMMKTINNNNIRVLLAEMVIQGEYITAPV